MIMKSWKKVERQHSRRLCAWGGCGTPTGYVTQMQSHHGKAGSCVFTFHVQVRLITLLTRRVIHPCVASLIEDTVASQVVVYCVVTQLPIMYR